MNDCEQKDALAAGNKSKQGGGLSPHLKPKRRNCHSFNVTAAKDTQAALTVYKERNLARRSSLPVDFRVRDAGRYQPGGISRTRNYSSMGHMHVNKLHNAEFTKYSKSTRSSSFSERKLQHFFGDFLPLDVSLREIQSDGLKALLQSKVPLAFFLHSLLEDFCSENLFFYLEADKYESFRFTTRSERLAMARRIYATYFNRESPFEINIDAKTREDVEKFLSPSVSSAGDIEGIDESTLVRVFSSSKKAVTTLLQASYASFRSSEIFYKLKSRVGDSPIYGNDVKQNALLLLRQHIDKYTQRDEAINLMDSVPEEIEAPIYRTSVTDRVRHCRIMVRDFCWANLRLDFDTPLSDMGRDERDGTRSPKTGFWKKPPHSSLDGHSHKVVLIKKMSISQALRKFGFTADSNPALSVVTPLE